MKVANLTPLPRPKWLPESIWPFQTDSLEVQGQTIAITDVGRGPVLLFVHTGMWSFVWRDVMTRLSNEFRCVCLDAPGTGRSSRMQTGAINLDRAARVVAEVIERLDLNDLIMVVHDLGGPAGLAGAARQADRIRGIVGVNAFAWRPSGAMFRGMLALMGSAPMREFDALTNAIPQITATSFGVGLHFSKASRQAFLAGIGRQGVRAFHAYLNDARKCDRLYEEVSKALAGPFKHLPLLTIFGERNDPLGFQVRWRELFPSARQVVVAKGNHFPMCDDPELVADSIRSWHRKRVTPANQLTVADRDREKMLQL